MKANIDTGHLVWTLSL